MINRLELQALHAAKRFARQPYAWPGAYPLFLITADSACLCSDCTRKEWISICAESFQDTNCGFRAAAVDINWEDTDLHCDHCGKQLESAYGADQ
jgi:hypothetical protein